MNKTTLLLLLSLSGITTVYGMGDESWEMVEAQFKEQVAPSHHLRSILTDPNTYELRIGQDTFETVIERLSSIPTPRHRALTDVFHSSQNYELLLQARAYDAEEDGCLPLHGRKKIWDITRQSDALSLMEIKEDYAQVSVPSAECEVWIALLKSGRRVTATDSRALYTCPWHLLSSLIHWAKVRKTIAEGNLPVEITSDMGAWHFAPYTPPQFSDSELILTTQPLSKRNPHPWAVIQYCQAEDASLKTIQALAEAGVWTPDQLAMAEDGRLQVTNFRQPDNTLPKEFMTERKLAWNRYAMYLEMQKVFSGGEERNFFAARAQEALSIHGSLPQ